MISGEMSIGELADAAGLSRRAVRFYVQRGLLQAPTGVGRGRHYGKEHLERLERIAGLQRAGHSLEGIRRVLEGGMAEVVAEKGEEKRVRPAMVAEVWTRVQLMEGVEVMFDSTKFRPEVEGLIALREMAREVFGKDEG